MTTTLLLATFFGITFLWTALTFSISIYISRSKRVKFSDDTDEDYLKLFPSIKAILLEYLSFIAVILLYPFGVFNRKIKVKRNDNNRIPVLLVHGYLHNNAIFFPLGIRLKRYKKVNVFTITLKPIFASIEHFAYQLKGKAEEIISLTGSNKINLITHSMGGLVARYYMQELEGASRINICITLACPHKGSRFAKIAFGKNGKEMRPESLFIEKINKGTGKFVEKIISIWSDTDNIVIPPENCVLDGARNIKVGYLGHIAFLFSPRVYRIIRDILEKI